jgi:hypothetical protein
MDSVCFKRAAFFKIFPPYQLLTPLVAYALFNKGYDDTPLTDIPPPPPGRSIMGMSSADMESVRSGTLLNDHYSKEGIATAGANSGGYEESNIPAPNSIIKRLLDGQSPASAAALVAQQGLNKFGSVKQLKKLATQLKAKDGTPDGFASKFGKTQLGGKPMGFDKKFSDYKQVYNDIVVGDKTANDLFSIEIKTQARAGFSKGGWDSATQAVNATEKYDSYTEFRNELVKYKELNQVWVLFKKEGNKSIVPFAGAVTGLSENVSPELTNFRYLGSPFKVNRYVGVERTLQFTLKLYYTTVREKDVMIKKVNYLKSLAFPYEQISEMKYGGFPEQIGGETSQYAFSPNLIFFSIGDLYKNMFGYVESLSFEIGRASCRERV